MRHVLKDINIKVKKGECVGLIGENGAGKSTMLKLLSKIIFPNSGEIVTRGRVACLIELGAGFHPDMSGRENIYTNASIFGLTKKEIDKRMILLLFLNWKSLLTILSGRIPAACICGWRFLSPFMWTRIFC